MLVRVRKCNFPFTGSQRNCSSVCLKSRSSGTCEVVEKLTGILSRRYLNDQIYCGSLSIAWKEFVIT